MNQQSLAVIVALLGISAFVSGLLRVVAAGIADRFPDRPRLQRIAGSRAWPATADAALVAWLTALGIEVALVGITEQHVQVLTIVSILGLSLLVGRWIDAIRDRSRR